MYCPSNLNAAVRKLSKSLKESTVTIESWYEKFVFTAHPLLLREICNLIYSPSQKTKSIVLKNLSAPLHLTLTLCPSLYVL